MAEIRRQVVVRSPQGIHTRIAVRLASIVRSAQAHLQLVSSKGTADASSPLALLQLGVNSGETIELVADKDVPQAVLDAIVLLLGAPRESARRWLGRGLVPGVGSGAPWWPREYASGQLPRPGEVLETDADWNLARLRVDEKLAIEEEMLHKVGAMDLLELVSAERELLSDERLTADLTRAPLSGASPRAEALADLSQRLFAEMRQSREEELPRQELVLMGYRVLVTHLLGPQARWIRGVITCEGGETSHTAIAARWLGIPMVTGFRPSDLEEMAVCDNLVVDGQEGSVCEQLGREGAVSSAQPAYSAVDRAQNVPVYANADSSEMVRAAIQAGAAGIGLVRSEVFYIGSHSLDEEEQVRQLQELLEAGAGREVTIRIADVYPGMTYHEDISQRGMALILRHREALQVQFRALLRAAAGNNLRVLLPLVRTVQEWRSARSCLQEEQRTVESYLGTRINVPLGAAVEVPAMVWCLEDIINEVDFISIGSNDLGALMFAQSREGSTLLDGRIGLQPAFWRCMARIASIAQPAGKPVMACGVLSGQWPEALLLHGLGFTLSLSLDRLQPIASMLAGWTVEKARKILDEALLCSTCAEMVRFLHMAGVPVRTEV